MPYTSVEKISAFLKNNNIMSLATCSDIGPSCCNCFYVFLEEEHMLVIMSGDKTRHVQEGLANGKAAGTVLNSKSSMMNLKGLQFHGEFIALDEKTTEKARKAYQKKFPASRINRDKQFWGIRPAFIRLMESKAGIMKKYEWPVLEES